MRPVLRILRAAILAGPAALAFASGGYFDHARLVALIVAWALAAAAVCLSDAPLPRSREGLAALGALTGYTGWIALSTTWAPLSGPAGDDLERAVLYLGAFVAVAAAFRPRSAARAVEPGLALGALVVTGYGLVGRLLPGIVHERETASAAGRLDQPLTYWNASGALAALGLILCARIAGDNDRRPELRTAAAAAAVPLAAGVYLSFSRGALAALAAGVIVLLVAAPSWIQLRSAAICLELGALGAGACAAFGGVRDLTGSLHSRELQGAAVFVALLALMAIAAAVARWEQRAECAGTTRLGPLPLPRWAPAAAAALVVAIVVVPVAIAKGTSTATPVAGETGARLSSVGSNRYEYWKVALKVAADHPVAGVGASGFAVEWLKRRPIDDPVKDAHSLELETLAELGLVGFALLSVLLGAIALAARRVHRYDPGLAAGPIAGLTLWALHAAIDWDWEMPALTLVAVVLAGMLVSRTPPAASRRPAR
jgi:O-antigen ligase